MFVDVENIAHVTQVIFSVGKTTEAEISHITDFLLEG
jgi:hypothetical protein